MTLLVFPSPDGCRRLCPDVEPGATLPALIADPRVRARVAEALGRLAAGSAGTSMRASRALLLDEPLSIDANEITDKDYVNQRAVHVRRAAQVERLYAATPDPAVITLPAA